MDDPSAYQWRLTPVKSSRRIGEERRIKIYEFVLSYADELDGPTPTINEVSQALAIDYKVTYYHVMKLIALGRLKQERGKLVVVGARWERPTF